MIFTNECAAYGAATHEQPGFEDSGGYVIPDIDITEEGVYVVIPGEL